VPLAAFCPKSNRATGRVEDYGISDSWRGFVVGVKIDGDPLAN